MNNNWTSLNTELSTNIPNNQPPWQLEGPNHQSCRGWTQTARRAGSKLYQGHTQKTSCLAGIYTSNLVEVPYPSMFNESTNANHHWTSLNHHHHHLLKPPGRSGPLQLLATTPNAHGWPPWRLRMVRPWWLVGPTTLERVKLLSAQLASRNDSCCFGL